MNFLTDKSWKRQDIRKREWALMIIKSTGIYIITAWLYYRTFWALIPLFPVWAWQLKMMTEEKYQRKELEFQMQFKDAVQTLASALNVGYSVENAMYETQKELLLIYAESERISKELIIMVRQMRLQMTVEQAFIEFAERVQMEDVRNFVDVFIAAKRSGGNMVFIIQSTVKQISDKIEVRREIETILAAKKYEFKIMAVIPYAIIGYMAVTFPEFMKCLYGNVLGIGVMTICLAGYLGAYYLGLKIITIDI